MENETAYESDKYRDGQEQYRSNELLTQSTRRYILAMYEEFKMCFYDRNFSKIEKIRNNIANVDPSSNILNVIYGAICLLKGECVQSYTFLMKYANNCSVVDPWALLLMGTWNLFAGEYSLALKQLSNIKHGEFTNRSISTIMFFAAKTKKRLGFFDKSKNYFERLMSTPEGYKLITIIKLELMHIRILRKGYDDALQEIEFYSRFSNNVYLERLKVYIHYMKGNYREILRYKKADMLDPYISYLIARIGLEDPKAYNIDIAYYLDETMKYTRENKTVYNTYGIYCYSKHRFSDAAANFKAALEIDPDFQPAIYNLSFLVKAETKSNKLIYVSKQTNEEVLLADADPDLEEMGFFDTWTLLGFSPFFTDSHFLKNSPSLKYYLNCD